MKITLQNVPPEIHPLYVGLVTEKQNLANAIIVVGARKAAKKPRPKKPTVLDLSYMDDTKDVFAEPPTPAGPVADAAERTGRTDSNPKRNQPPKTANQWLQQAAAILTQRRIQNGEDIDPQTEYERSLDELQRGIFNPHHWKKCNILTEDYLQNVPVSTPDLTPKPYHYPEAGNLTTDNAYGAGTPSDAPARYHGSSEAGRFKDRLLVWRRAVYILINKFAPGAVEPTFIKINADVTAFGDERGSRPMHSMIFKTFMTAEDSARWSTTEPPLPFSWHFYYRYKIPKTNPPYYNVTQNQKAVRTMRQPHTEEAAAELTHSVVLSAPRPMYGHGYNNNQQVTTQMRADIDIMQIDLTPINDNLRHVVIFQLIAGVFRTDSVRSTLTGLEFQRTVSSDTNWAGYARTMANQSSRILASEVEQFLIDAGAELGTCAGMTATVERHIVSNVSNQAWDNTDEEPILISDWMAGGAEALDQWSKDNNVDFFGTSQFFCFVWIQLENLFIPLLPSDWFATESGQVGLKESAADQFKIYNRPIYLGDSLYWSPPSDI